MTYLKQKDLSTAIKLTLGTTSLLLASSINIANAGNVKGFGEDDLQNNGDPYIEREGLESLSIRVPAASTSVTLSGYVKGDARFDDGADLGDSFVVSSIPIDGSAGDDRDGHFRIHARQSRLTIRSNTELENGQTLTTAFEGDFFGGGGNETFSNSTLSLIHISEPTRRTPISYAVFCLKKNRNSGLTASASVLKLVKIIQKIGKKKISAMTHARKVQNALPNLELLSIVAMSVS